MIPPLGTAKQAALVENVSTIWSRQKVEMELGSYMMAKYKESKVKFRYAHGVKVRGNLIVLLANRKLTENSLVVIEHVFDHWYIVCKEPS